MAEEPTISDLVARDQDVWRVAFSILYPIAYRTAKSARVNLSDSDAEEVAAQALREIADCVEKVDSFDGLKALTVTISRRRSISKLRMITARSRGSHLTDSIEASQETEDSFGLQLRDEALTPDQDLEHADLIHAVREFINTLEGNVKNVVGCIYVEGLSYKESAEKLGMTTSNVGVYLSRGLQRLKREFEKNSDWVKYFREFVR